MIEFKHIYLKRENEYINDISFKLNNGDFLNIICEDKKIITDFLVSKSNYIGKVIVDTVLFRNLDFIGVEDSKIKNKELTCFDYACYKVRKTDKKEEYIESECLYLFNLLNIDFLSGVLVRDISEYQIFLLNLISDILLNKRLIVVDYSDNRIKDVLDLIKEYRSELNVIVFNDVSGICNLTYDISNHIEIEDNNKVIVECKLNDLNLELLNNKFILNDIYMKRVLDRDIKYAILDLNKLKLENDRNDIELKIVDKSEKGKIVFDDFIYYYNNRIDLRHVSSMYYDIDDLIFLNTKKDIVSLDYVPSINRILIDVVNPFNGLVMNDKVFLNLNTKINKKCKAINLNSNHVFELSNKDGIRINHIYEYRKFKDFDFIDCSVNDTRLNIRIESIIDPFSLIGKSLVFNNDSFKESNY